MRAVTFSIVARDESGTHWGVAVASKFLAAGAVVPAARAGVGAIASQAFANLAYRPDGLSLLESGIAAQDVVDTLTAADEGRDHRQVGVVDAAGGSATFTGAACLPWAGGTEGPGFAVQGNILTGPGVVDAMVAAWLGSDPAAPLARRLHAALLAGDRAGGDARGRQAAAILVVTEGGGYGGGTDVLVDLRVDDHPDPVPDLARMLDIHDMLFGHSDPDDCLALEGAVLADVTTQLSLPPDSPVAEVEAALATWAGIENLEERLVPGRIDPVVLGHLRSVGVR